MKTLILIFTVILTLAISRCETKPEPADLEIYTPENIYYIEGLTVTNESNSETFTFKTKTELKEFISDRTADDTQKCADQWNQ
jgi:hypothetical protein